MLLRCDLSRVFFLNKQDDGTFHLSEDEKTSGIQKHPALDYNKYDVLLCLCPVQLFSFMLSDCSLIFMSIQKLVPEFVWANLGSLNCTVFYFYPNKHTEYLDMGSNYNQQHTLKS